MKRYALHDGLLMRIVSFHGIDMIIALLVAVVVRGY